jgi:class 3 adenylate cyclase/DNA-binding CsgD family transcriptional regulator
VERIEEGTGLAQPQDARELPEGTVTVLFTDVEGSTELRTREGDQVAQDLLRTHERILRDHFRRGGGFEVAFLGDGFMVAFPSARGAVACAIGIQRDFEEHNRQAPDRPIRVRIGLNTGEVVRESGTLYGAAVNAAARIMAQARGGQIVISQVVKDLVGAAPEFRFEDVGLRELKGFPTKWRLFQVPWEKSEGVPPTEELARAAGPRPAGTTTALTGLAETVARPSAAPIVGRSEERSAIEQEMGLALSGSVRVVSVEGEAGIGKTRVMEAAMEAAADRGFGVVLVAADEELGGPFFLLRTLFSSSSIEALAEETGCEAALGEARDVLWGREDGREGLAPAEHVLRIYDAATLAIRSIASVRPLAILFDDIHWADEDSLKLIRYVIRTSPLAPVVLLLGMRPEPGPGVSRAEALMADLERMRLARRLALPRFTLQESREFLEVLLGGPVSRECAATLHERGEGVPFFVEAFARSYQEAGSLQVVEGEWKLAASARRAGLPTSIQVLIERRLSHLPEETRSLLGDAAVLGRRFRLPDLVQVASALGPAVREIDAAEMLGPAVQAALISELPGDAAHDYTFTHDEIRSVLVSLQPRQRRRQVHAAILDMLTARTKPTAETLPALAHHAIEAGDAERGVRYSIDAARAALDVHGAEEALRAVDAARELATAPADRAELLWLRDEALAVLLKGQERLATLAELAALGAALGEPEFELEVALRRAAAARQAEDHEQAVAFAEEAVAAAEGRGDRRQTLRAVLELGQAQMRKPLGEAFAAPPSEIDLDVTTATFTSALNLAEEVRDEWAAAAAHRELGVVGLAKAKRRFLELAPHFSEMVVSTPGLLEDPELDLRNEPVIRAEIEVARDHAQAAVEAFERLGDRRALMSSLIALAYTNIIEDSKRGHAGRIEVIRRLRERLNRLVSESERIESELHMLFSIQVYARSHAYPDLALHRGAEAYELARASGNRRFEFLAAGGVALTHIEMAEVPEAEAWLDRAGSAALETPGPLPARQLETWHGLLRSAAGDPAEMTERLERALALATDRGSPAGQCELLSSLALHSALHGTWRDDPSLLDAAERWAEETVRVAHTLPGDLVWEAKALAALALVSAARGEEERAVAQAEAAVEVHERTLHIYPLVYPDLLLAVARILVGREGTVPTLFRARARQALLQAIHGTQDDAVRSRWFRAPIQRELAELVGMPEDVEVKPGEGVDEGDTDLLRRVAAGQTNREMAEDLGLTEDEVAARLASLYSRTGVSTDVEAAVFSMQEGVA